MIQETLAQKIREAAVAASSEVGLDGTEVPEPELTRPKLKEHGDWATNIALVLASRAETYGMVVTEALARGLPVVATAVGGLPEALGHGADGTRPGLLVPPGDAASLTAALRCWLGNADVRHRLRNAAHERRTTLSGWSDTSVRISHVLAKVAG